MIVQINNTTVTAPDLSVRLQLPTSQDPRTFLTLQATVSGGQLRFTPVEDATVVVQYEDGTQAYSGRGSTRTHFVETRNGQDVETASLELVQG